MKRCEERTWETPDARGARPADGLWAQPSAFWSEPRNSSPAGGYPAGTQRHGQDHDGALDHGHRSTAAGNDFLSKRITCGPAVVPYRPGRDRPGARRPPGVAQPYGARKPPRHGRQSPRREGSVDARAGLYPVSELEGEREQLRQPALRRRAADARHRQGADDQPANADPRRGDRGPRAARALGDLPLDRAAEGRRIVDPADRQGRARTDPRRASTLRAGERPGGLERQLGRPRDEP